MNMIFPGMDPYLEDPQLWKGFHTSLIVYIRNYLQPLIKPRYVAAIDERVYVEGPDRHIVPDVWARRSSRVDSAPSVAVLETDVPVVLRAPQMEVHEAYVTILDRHANLRLITSIEVVSPANKYAGPGRESYLAKQREVRESKTHLVEIDLLRLGPHVLAIPEWMARGQGPYDYLVCVNRAEGLREEFDLYPRRLTERLPRIRIPLGEGDADTALDLQRVVNQAYDDGSYEARIDYSAPCKPPLSPEDQTWANELIAQAQKTPAEEHEKV